LGRTGSTDGANAPQGDAWGCARRDLRFRVRLSLPSTRPALDGAVARVSRIASKCGCSDDRRVDLEIALREALANAIQHGNGSIPRRKVFLRCYAGPNAGIFIAIRDEGTGFDPKTIPDPRTADRKHLHHGRGLLLMRGLTDEMLHRRGGREVVLVNALNNGR
jgi:serine/threonine-protein kinase RsbW